MGQDRIKEEGLGSGVVPIAFETLLGDPGSPLFTFLLENEAETERFVEVARRVESGEGPEKDPAIGLPVAEGDRLRHESAAQTLPVHLRRDDEPAEVRAVRCRLGSVNGDCPGHPLLVPDCPEAVAFLFEAPEEFRKLRRDLGLEEEAEFPVAVVVGCVQLGDAADGPRAIIGNLVLHLMTVSGFDQQKPTHSFASVAEGAGPYRPFMLGRFAYIHHF